MKIVAIHQASRWEVRSNNKWVKGYQVAPAELEEVIRNFHSVEDVAVVGVPHPVLGEAPKAYVVPKNKGTFVPEEVEHFVAARLTKYKHLKGGVEVVDSIPRNPSGKILRRLMKKH
ncbi:hypothetical protein JTB14_009842 [Gonioctena quinquepunctata]|nr:hypothetical protein JTB14_009842 [Gonioctena quinquepunctata]